MAVIGALVVAVLMLIPIMVLRAWALVTLWAWFAVPGLGAPALTYPIALGLSLIVGMFRDKNGAKDKEKGAFEQVAGMVIESLMAVGLGWIIKGFM